ncbi:hypothetical protein GPECTOR_51g730 [Gonium pectorale]|uniref:TRP C-terminal domain-containing protein n=1 Tax=Gonium pectorale TaxID=33097 RepID=A0A150G7C8_GONPE|nr:hypothetical protein GPECTOR_51g730 [Gonium pectorale]|eukprot:KXZ45744.1 hypothetical protein GPECTOR_51g730 [Gonium pectorale]
MYGYWHSAPDSALFHRCPKEEACGKDSHGSWANMPDVSPALLQVGFAPSGGVALVSNSTSLITDSGLNVTGIVWDTAVARSAGADQGLVLNETTTRAGWLALCQNLGYLAAANNLSGNVNASSSPALSGGEIDDALGDLVARECQDLRTSASLAVLSFLGGVALVAIVHAQYYIIITRLPIAYPDVINKLSGTVSAMTGAESTVAFSYSCFFAGLDSAGQARAQTLGALIVPAIVVTASLVIWTLRYMFLNRARMRRASNLRGPGRRTERHVQAALKAAAAAGTLDQDPNDPEAVQDKPVQQSNSIVKEAPKPPFSARVRQQIQRVKDELKMGVRRIQESELVKVLIRLDETLSLKQQMGTVVMIAVFILYPGWAQASLSIFACYLIDDGTTGPFPERQQATWKYGYWIRDMSQKCYASRHLQLYLPIGIVAVIIVCLTPPLTSFALLWYNRKKLNDPTTLRRYGFLYVRYKKAFFWWESVLMLEELILVAVEVFGRALPIVSHQILLMLVTFIALSLVNMACSPVRSRLIVLLEFLSMGVLSLTVTLSLFFVVSDKLGSKSATVVGLIIMLINVLLLAAFLSLVIKNTWGSMRTKGAKIARGLKSQLEQQDVDSVVIYLNVPQC